MRSCRMLCPNACAKSAVNAVHTLGVSPNELTAVAVLALYNLFIPLILLVAIPATPLCTLTDNTPDF